MGKNDIGETKKGIAKGLALHYNVNSKSGCLCHPLYRYSRKVQRLIRKNKDNRVAYLGSGRGYFFLLITSMMLTIKVIITTTKVIAAKTTRNKVNVSIIGHQLDGCQRNRPVI